jgi:hypothetical protein
MNSYLQLLLIGFFITTVSYIIENIYPCVNDLDKSDVFGLYFFRFIHLTLYVYFSFFLLIFNNYRTFDSIVYIILSFLLFISWRIFGCCVASYYELKFYQVNHLDYPTTFHPCLNVIFREYREIAQQFMGIMMAFTFGYIMFKNKTIPSIYKIPIAIAFTYFFVENALTRKTEKSKYPEDPNHILYRYSLV